MHVCRAQTERITRAGFDMRGNPSTIARCVVIHEIWVNC
jgi:hypothetical protein